MTNGATLRYLTFTFRSFFERAASGTGLLLLTVALVLIGLGSFFYAYSGNNFSAGTLGTTLFCVFLVGGWSGIRYLFAFRPNGWNWLKKSHWFYLSTFPPIVITAILSLVVLWPYYIAQVPPALSLTALLIKLILLFLTFSVFLFGLSLAAAVRTLSRNPYLRVTLYVLISYAAAALLLGSGPIVLHQALVGDTNTLLVLLLFTTGLIGTSILFLQLNFDRLKLAERSPYQFWNTSGATRLLNQVHHPAVGYFLTKLVWYVRSSAFHRRLIGYFLFVFTVPYVSTLLELSNRTVLIIELLVVWLGVFLIVRPSGEKSATDSLWLKTQPIKFVPARADLLAALLVVLVVIVATVQFFSVSIITIQLISGLSAAMIIFQSSRNAAMIQTLKFGLAHKHDRIILGNVVVSLVFVFLPVMLLPNVSVATTGWLMILWLVGVTLAGEASRRIRHHG